MTSQLAGAPAESSAVDVTSPQAGNRHGRITGLTLLSPIRRQWVPIQRASFWLGKWVPMAQKHILQFDFIHFVRWTVIKELPYNGTPQERDRLTQRYLLFESNFDGPWQHYIDAFAYCIPNDIRLVWGRGINFPAPPPAEALKGWIAANSLEGGSYYCAYPLASTREVVGALAVGEQFDRLAADSKGLAPEQFKARYEQFLAAVQAHL